MWQEIVAVDSKFNERRMMEAKDLRPLYLKRRLQLLQAQENKPVNPELDPDQYVMRNKKYISLRVKLLKKQFGLPSDLVSLRSLSLSPATPAIAPSTDIEHSDRSCYNGVHHVIELESRLTSRLMFSHGTCDSLIFACSDGFVNLCELSHPHSRRRLKICTNSVVTDYDINDSNELMVAAAQDGSFVVWNVVRGHELRRFDESSSLLPRGVFVSACRFLPRNNNLVICSLSNGLLHVLNVSTGKFSNQDCGGGAHMLGKTVAVAMNATGSVLWAANDRGYIESFRVDSSTGKLQKGCRVQANAFGKPVTSMTARTSISKITKDPCLLATFELSDQLGLYRITDDFGTIVPFKSFSSGSGANLRCAIIAPILSYRHGTLAVAGAEDGTLLFFDLERDSRPCINKLLGHSEAVAALGFSHDESLLASADVGNQIIVWRKS